MSRCKERSHAFEWLTDVKNPLAKSNRFSGFFLNASAVKNAIISPSSGWERMYRSLRSRCST